MSNTDKNTDTASEINLDSLTVEQRRALVAKLSEDLPKRGRGRPALVTDEMLAECYNGTRTNKEAGIRLMAATLTDGSLGSSRWESPEKAHASMAVRVKDLRASGKITATRQVGRPAEPKSKDEIVASVRAMIEGNPEVTFEDLIADLTVEPTAESDSTEG